MNLLPILALLMATASLAETIQGRVIGITDGDTITILNASNTPQRIRLAGIDAPEKEQAYGMRSKENLSAMLYGKEATIETSKIDRYGRTIGKILVKDMDANLEQIKRGMAWHYKAYQHEQSPQDRNDYAAAEIEARNGKRGLWQDAESIPPWDFRKTSRMR